MCARQHHAGIGYRLDNSLYVKLGRHGCRSSVHQLKLMLHPLSRGDINHGADEADRTAGLEKRFPRCGNPALLAIPKADRPVFDVVAGGGARRERLAYGLVGPCAIFRVEARQEGAFICHLRVRRQTKKGFAPVVPTQHSADGIVIPGANSGRVGGKPQPLLAGPCRLFRANALDVSPGPLRHLGQQGQFALRPDAALLVVDGHQGSQSALFDQRHTDGCRYPDILKGLRFLGSNFLKVVVDDKRLVGAEVGDSQATEIGKTVISPDAGRARCAPIAADGEMVLVLLHVGIGANRDAKMFAEEPSGDLHDSIGVGREGYLPAEAVEKSKAFGVLTEGQFGAKAFYRRTRPVRDCRNEGYFLRRPASGRGVVQV